MLTALLQAERGAFHDAFLMVLCKDLPVDDETLSPNPCPPLSDEESQLTQRCLRERRAQLCAEDVAATLVLETLYSASRCGF